MANKIQIKRGANASIPVLSDGEPGWSTDGLRLFVGQGGTNRLVGEADFVKLAGSTMTGALVLSGDPTLALHAATKQYVDNLINGIDAKASVRLATAAALPSCVSAGAGATHTLTAGSNGVLAVDSVNTVLGDRILVKNQAAAKDNGVYTVTQEGTAGAKFVLTRAAEADTWAELVASYIWVEVGSTLADTGWLCTIDAGGTLETNDITFVQFAAAGAAIAGNGLTKAGNTFDVGGGDGVVIAADGISVGIDTAAGLVFDASSPKKIQVHIEADHEFTAGGIRLAAYSGGDITKAAGATSATINTAAVTLAKMANLAQNTIIGRVTASTGVPEALTAANVRTIINVADGATANAKASAAEVETGTDDVKFLTAASVHSASQHQIPHVAPGTNGNVLQSNGTDWTSAAMPAPGAHTHGNITNDGKIGTTATLPIITGASGVLSAGAFGSSAGQFCQGNDARLHTQGTDTGTTADHFDIYTGSGVNGVSVHASGGILLVRNLADDAYASLGAKTVEITGGLGTGDTITKIHEDYHVHTLPDSTGTLLDNTSTIDGGTW